MFIRRKGRCGVFAGNCVIHICALSGRVSNDRRYTNPLPFLFLSSNSESSLITKPNHIIYHRQPCSQVQRTFVSCFGVVYVERRRTEKQQLAKEANAN